MLKRKITLLTMLVTAAVLCMAATTQSFLRTQAAGKSFPVVEEKYTSYDTAAYILKEHGGYVAVFSSNASELLEMTAIPVSVLPLGDRILLENGITANNRQALLELLEDLNS